eukprot:11023358-Alexandrium_andersonii.AAC.1
MSASLVGSEMCIRDRANSMPIRAPKRCAPDGGPEDTRMLVVRLRPNAVSYTHLTLPTICSV